MRVRSVYLCERLLDKKVSDAAMTQQREPVGLNLAEKKICSRFIHNFITQLRVKVIQA